MTTNDTSSFPARLSEYGTSIFQDPLTQLTRDRQKGLLVTSFIAIALSSTAVSVTDLSIGGAKFTIQSSETVQFVSGMISLYFLAAYILCVLQDLNVHRYRTILPSVNMQEMLAGKAQADWARATANSQKAKKIGEQSALLWDEIEAIDQKYVGDSLSIQRMQEKAPIYEKLKLLGEQADELMKADIGPASSALKVTEKQLNLVRRIWSTSRHLSGARLAIEVVFPIGLALLAIWMSVFN